MVHFRDRGPHDHNTADCACEAEAALACPRPSAHAGASHQWIEPCQPDMSSLSAPILNFGGYRDLPDCEAYLRENLIERSFSLTGPGETAEPGHLPVRGDLAHIRLAGRYFVPHYAVPMPHRLKTGTSLRKAASHEAEAIEQVAAASKFNVLDIAGGWAWGQVGDDGFTGYLPMSVLEQA